MAPALSTTKRKFHKILDSISNASSTSLVLKNQPNNSVSNVALSTDFEPPTKKYRVTRPNSAFAKSATLRAVSQTSSSRISATMDEERKAPNFAPWDRVQFLERLQTYRHVDKWMGKPEIINEVQWAKRGWSCVGKERVGCVGGCGKEVVVKLEEDCEGREPKADEILEEEDQEWREDAKAQLISRYAELIITEHDTGCLWRRRGCDDAIQRLPLAYQATALSNLRERYTSLNAMSSELPLTLSTPPSFDNSTISQSMSSTLSLPQSSPTTPPTTPSTNTQHPPINTLALTLALFGWQAEPSPISGLATCAACFRRLGLWLFKAPKNPSSPTASQPSTPLMTRLDVIAEHRDYCPWVNPTSQSLSSTTTKNPTPRSSASHLAGWEILTRVVLNANPPRPEPNRPPQTGVPRATTGEQQQEEEDRAEIASVVSEVPSTTTTTTQHHLDRTARDEKDRERWAKLKRLKQVFHVGRAKGKGKENIRDGRVGNVV